MIAKNSLYEKELKKEIASMPLEYLPNLIKIVRLFRETIELKPAKDSFEQGFKEALSGDTRSVSDLWDGIDVK